MFLMGILSPSDAAPRGLPRRRLAAGALLASLALCILAAGLAARSYSIPDVRPPFPKAQLVSEETTWDVRGFHTVRVYRASGRTMRDLLEWYFEADILGRYEQRTEDPPTFDYTFHTPAPAHPLSRLFLARYSQVNFITRNGYIEIVTDTHFYWRVLN